MGGINSKINNIKLDPFINNISDKVNSIYTRNIQNEQHNKVFIIYSQNDGSCKSYLLNIKIMDGHIYLYITDIIQQESRLVNVTMVKITDHNTIQYYMRFIQISNDFRFISFPENDTINVYDLKKLLIDNSLEYIGTLGKFTKNIVNPLKCLLFGDIYIIIDIGCNVKISIINYKLDTINELDGINKDHFIKTSRNGKYIVIGNKNVLQMYDLMRKTITKIDININIFFNTICISDDGEIISYLVNNDLVIYSVKMRKMFKLLNGTTMDTIDLDLSTIKFYLLDYNWIVDLDITNNYSEYVYVLVGCTNNMNIVYYWIIIYSNDNFQLCSPYRIETVNNEQIEYVYCTGSIFIYKTPTRVVIYDLNNIIPIQYIELLTKQICMRINRSFRCSYNEKLYHNTIILNGTDDSCHTYNLDPFVQYLLSLFKSKVNNDLKSMNNSNINIYGTIKSFDILQGLLTGSICYDTIIKNIFLIKGSRCRYNTISELMDHIYEYIQMFGISEDNSGLDVSLYFGYILLLLVLKFYVVSSYTNQREDKKYLKNDIMDKYVKYFPIFNECVCQLLSSISQ